MISSDVHERLPMFYAMQTAVADAAQDGAFAGLPFDASPYIDGMQPVGLDSRRKLIVPRNHRPEAGPAVLMLQPGDIGQKVTLRASTRNQVETGRTIAAEAGSRTNVRRQTIKRLPVRSIPYTNTLGRILWLSSDGNVPIPRPVLLPTIIEVLPMDGQPSDQVAAMIGHEFDHWDFYMTEQGRLQGGGDALPYVDWLRAVTEKRAYASTTRILRNLGHRAIADSMADLAEMLLPDFQLGKDALISRIKKLYLHANPGRAPELGSAALAVQIVEHLHGKPDKLITPRELASIERLGYM